MQDLIRGTGDPSAFGIIDDPVKGHFDETVCQRSCDQAYAAAVNNGVCGHPVVPRVKASLTAAALALCHDSGLQHCIGQGVKKD